MLTADQITRAARSLKGTPFRRGGRTPGMRLDCAGVIIVTADRIGYTYKAPAPDSYTLRDEAAMLLRTLRANMIEDPSPQLLAGRVLVMSFTGGEAQHAGILTSSTTILHAYMHVRKVVETSIPDDWYPKIRHTFKFRGTVE